MDLPRLGWKCQFGRQRSMEGRSCGKCYRLRKFSRGRRCASRMACRVHRCVVCNGDFVFLGLYQFWKVWKSATIEQSNRPWRYGGWRWNMCDVLLLTLHDQRGFLFARQMKNKEPKDVCLES